MKYQRWKKPKCYDYQTYPSQMVIQPKHLHGQGKCLYQHITPTFFFFISKDNSIYINEKEVPEVLST